MYSFQWDVDKRSRNMTRIWKIQSTSLEKDDLAIQEAASLIREGGIIAFPTETVYGLGGDATNDNAIQKIFLAKGRPADNPLIVHIAERNQLHDFVSEIPAIYDPFIDAFWPGPLTLVFPLKARSLSKFVTAGLSSVGVRIPSDPVALRLLSYAKCPIAAPSANRSGRPSPTLGDHVRDDLEGRIDGILDCGSTGIGLESTVLSFQDNKLHILRPGSVTYELLKQVNAQIEIIDGGENTVVRETTPTSPGIKYTHYAPKGLLQLVTGSSKNEIFKYISSELIQAKRRGETTGVMVFDEHEVSYQADLVIDCGRVLDPATIAQNLYHALRRFDEAGISYILSETCPETGIGAAVMNRLRKASNHRSIDIS
jgi:L-threonylcarbamoyladenylate synthase